MRRLLTSIASALAILSLAGMKTPRPVVGTILSTGSFQLDHTTLSGTGTILNGDQIASSDQSSRILLRNGVNLDLSPRSGGAVYADHATLDSGTLHIKSSTGSFPVDFKSFVVTPTSPNTNAILQVSGNSLTVNVSSGNALIASAASGQTLARLTSGLTLAFDPLDPDPGPEMSVRLLGVLDNENGHYLVRDRFSNSVSEVVGSVSPRLVNHMVAVDGKTFVNQKSTVAQVDRLVQISKLAASDAAMGLPCAADGAGGVAKLIGVSGVLSKVRNHFLVQDDKKKTYEVLGDIADAEVGTNIHEKGFLLPTRATILPAESVVYLERRKLIAMASPCVGAMVGSSLITTGVLAAPGNPGTAQANPISF
jgi:hypothetical protein